MWPILVEFGSASSENRWRKKERRRKSFLSLLLHRKKKESVVKHKSADRYVGRPKEGGRGGGKEEDGIGVMSKDL